MQKQKTLEELAKELAFLNNHINSIKPWGGYAEACQREYDFLLREYNEEKQKQKESKCSQQ